MSLEDQDSQAGSDDIVNFSGFSSKKEAEADRLLARDAFAEAKAEIEAEEKHKREYEDFPAAIQEMSIPFVKGLIVSAEQGDAEKRGFVLPGRIPGKYVVKGDTLEVEKNLATPFIYFDREGLSGSQLRAYIVDYQMAPTFSGEKMGDTWLKFDARFINQSFSRIHVSGGGKWGLNLINFSRELCEAQGTALMRHRILGECDALFANEGILSKSGFIIETTKPPKLTVYWDRPNDNRDDKTSPMTTAFSYQPEARGLIRDLSQGDIDKLKKMKASTVTQLPLRSIRYLCWSSLIFALGDSDIIRKMDKKMITDLGGTQEEHTLFPSRRAKLDEALKRQSSSSEGSSF